MYIKKNIHTHTQRERKTKDETRLLLLLLLLLSVEMKIFSEDIIVHNKNVFTKFLLFYFYIAGMLLPAWLVIVFVSIGEIIFGVILYFILRRVVLSSTVPKQRTTYQPRLLDERA